MPDEQTDFGEPWKSGYADHSPDISNRDGHTIAWEIPEELPVAYLDRLIICVNFLAGVPSVELERLMAQRVDEKLREEIRAAYRAGRWCDESQ